MYSHFPLLKLLFYPSIHCICHVDWHLMWEYICYGVMYPETYRNCRLEPRGWLPDMYDKIRNACWKVWIQSLKGNNLGGKQTLFDLFFLKPVYHLTEDYAWLPIRCDSSRNQSLKLYRILIMRMFCHCYFFKCTLLWQLKIVLFFPKHPKWGQNPTCRFTPRNTTASIADLFIW